MSESEHCEQRPSNDFDAVISEWRLLVNLGYRLLGSVVDAEDAVQETYARWYNLSERQRHEIGSPTGWLVTTASRICLDLLGSARIRRERYVGEWLPEPLPGDSRWTSQRIAESTVDPADRVTLDESVTMALLVVLEAMTPAERVAFVLHDVFRYSFAEIAGRSPGACRQLASSARRRVRSSQSPYTGAEHHADIVRAFKTGWETGDLTALVKLLDPHATAVTDGGGLVSAAVDAIEGAESIARYVLDVYGREPDLVIHETTVNGRPGLLAQANGTVLAVISIDVADDHVKHIWAVRNPEKLVAWTIGG